MTAMWVVNGFLFIYKMPFVSTSIRGSISVRSKQNFTERLVSKTCNYDRMALHYRQADLRLDAVASRLDLNVGYG